MSSVWLKNQALLKGTAKVLVLSVFLLFSACGKNEPILPIGPNGGQNNPNYYPQAPVPPNGGYYPPTGGGGGGGYSPYFNPTMPNGMPPQYTPWLPIDNYFRQTPQMTNVWVNIWVGWQGYARQRGYNPYDFPRFWLDYCPNQFYGTSYEPVINYFDSNVYYWVNYDTQFQYQDPAYFWQNYQGMPYTNINIDVCGGGTCY